MTPDVKTSFLTYYLRSLGERTRDEDKGTKFGFDWVVYNIGLAEDWSPVRLPFLRAGTGETSTAKTETEFGVDLSFLTKDKRTLFVFVLKDEVLNNKNWGKHSFDVDLRNASSPDLSTPEMSEVDHVQIVLAYNKDETQDGLRHFNNLVSNLPSVLRDSVNLTCHRWNLTTLVERVQDKLLSPSLIPQKFYSQFAYLCSQFGDFRHGSDQWEQQLVPNWMRFLSTLLDDKSDERSIRLLPVALIVLREHGKSNPTIETGWIELAEWGMLAAWEVARKANSTAIREVVTQLWLEMYLFELERFYETNAHFLAVEYGVAKYGFGGFVDAVASAVVAQWHIARLGIFGLAIAELMPATTNEQVQKKGYLFATVSAWLNTLLKANPAASRPLLDIHHIQLFLIWRTLYQIGRVEDLADWMQHLQNYLAMRRFGETSIPFLSGSNDLNLVFEAVASGVKPHNFRDQSSVFLMCFLELCFSLPEANRDCLVGQIYRRLVLQRFDDGPGDDCRSIDLMLWLPPSDWVDRVLTEQMHNEGECITIRLLEPHQEATDQAVVEAVRRFVDVTRVERPCKLEGNIPLSVAVLACIKHGKPLPPEFWRSTIFGELAPS